MKAIGVTLTICGTLLIALHDTSLLLAYAMVASGPRAYENVARAFPEGGGLSKVMGILMIVAGITSALRPVRLIPYK